MGWTFAIKTRIKITQNEKEKNPQKLYVFICFANTMSIMYVWQLVFKKTNLVTIGRIQCTMNQINKTRYICNILGVINV